jgi:hypothetical protein
MSRRFDCAAYALASEVFSVLKGELPSKQLESLKNRDYLAVVSATVDPSTFANADEFRDSYLAAELMSKFPNWDIGVDKKAVAISKFLASEVVCTETNFRLSQRFVNGVLSPYTPESLISSAREKIARLLGPFSWDLAERYFGFGPGATSSIRSRLGDAYYKYKAKPCATGNCAVLAYTCLTRVPRWFSHVVTLSGHSEDSFEALSLSERIAALIDVVPGNSITTVPKNAKTDRIIAIEPTMNGYVQHGIGGLIRSRLRRVGIDLNNQSKNQELARLGSESGLLFTLDLSSASDTVSMRLVEELLPPDWCDAIKLSRCNNGVLPDGTQVEYSKVSSMGCGFTFELESLVFWALTQSVISAFRPIDRSISVYGDDIIASVDVYQPLTWLLKYCGFSVNTKKSFATGCFRESCGKHYFSGTDVTPFYIREDITSPERAIWFSNQVRRFARLSWGLDGRFLRSYRAGIKLLPLPLRRPTISEGYGDAALFGDFDEVQPRRLPHFLEGWSGTVHVRVNQTRQFSDTPYLLRSLQGPRESDATNVDILVAHLQSRIFSRKGKKLVLLKGSGVSIPSSEQWRSVKIPIAQFLSFGPWLGS